MITFGIITADLTKNQDKIDQILGSIDQNRSSPVDTEVIIVSDKEIIKMVKSQKLTKNYVMTTKLEKEGWITAKKNLITKLAMYDNIVYMHDYIKLEPGWHEGLMNFGFDWDVCMNKILNYDGTRYRDFCSWDDPDLFDGQWIQREKWCIEGLVTKGRPCLIPYNYKRTNFMYVSGAYFVAKKKFMLDNQFDETLFWGDAEDVEWSRRVRDKWNYKMNELSSVKLLKQKDLILPNIGISYNTSCNFSNMMEVK